jgi:hypothetical protein
MIENFSEREKGFEAEFARNQDLAFRIAARRNRLFGLWAAGRLNLPSAESSAYAAAVVSAALEAQADDELIDKMLADFTTRGAELSEAELRRELARAGEAARQQLRGLRSQ